MSDTPSNDPLDMLDTPAQKEDTPAEKFTKAVAIEYDREIDDAPRVTASGKGAIAEQILSIAFEQGIKVREDADLVEVLSMVDIDSPIPLEAFATVAEILAYVYNANAVLKQNKWSQKAGNPLEDF